MQPALHVRHVSASTKTSMAPVHCMNQILSQEGRALHLREQQAEGEDDVGDDAGADDQRPLQYAAVAQQVGVIGAYLESGSSSGNAT